MLLLAIMQRPWGSGRLDWVFVLWQNRDLGALMSLEDQLSLARSCRNAGVFSVVYLLVYLRSPGPWGAPSAVGLDEFGALKSSAVDGGDGGACWQHHCCTQILRTS